MVWEVVTTLKEPLPLTLAFVAHHLEMGAEKMHLFFDDPHDPALPYLAEIDQVIVHVCDRDFWQGKRPKIHNDRQRHNANLAKAQCQADWLLNCDADEFLEDGAALRNQLNKMPPEILVARMRVKERCFVETPDENSIFSGWGRVPIRAPQYLPNFYVDLDALLYRGMCGYSKGKAFVRRDAQVFVGLHDATPIGADGKIDKTAEIARRWIKRQTIVHFDGLSPLYTARKMLNKPIFPGKQPSWRSARRQAQIDLYQQAAVDPRDLFFLLRTVPPRSIPALRLLGFLRRITIDPSEAVRRRWPDADVLFTMEAIDAVFDSV